MKLNIKVDIDAGIYVPDDLSPEDFPSLSVLEEHFKETLLDEIKSEMDVERIEVKMEVI